MCPVVMNSNNPLFKDVDTEAIQTTPATIQKSRLWIQQIDRKMNSLAFGNPKLLLRLSILTAHGRSGVNYFDVRMHAGLATQVQHRASHGCGWAHDFEVIIGWLCHASLWNRSPHFPSIAESIAKSPHRLDKRMDCRGSWCCGRSLDARPSHSDNATATFDEDSLELVRSMILAAPGLTRTSSGMSGSLKASFARSDRLEGQKFTRRPPSGGSCCLTSRQSLFAFADCCRECSICCSAARRPSAKALYIWSTTTLTWGSVRKGIKPLFSGWKWQPGVLSSRPFGLQSRIASQTSSSDAKRASKDSSPFSRQIEDRLACVTEGISWAIPCQAYWQKAFVRQLVETHATWPSGRVLQTKWLHRHCPPWTYAERSNIRSCSDPLPGSGITDAHRQQSVPSWLPSASLFQQDRDIIPGINWSGFFR